MIIVALSDIHLRETPPSKRIDNYLDALCYKINQIFDYLKELRESHTDKIVLAIGGDVFDSCKASNALKSLAIDLFGRMYTYLDEIVAVAGQHDMRWHSTDLTNTPINVLHTSRVLTILGKEPLIITDNDKSFHFYGASYGEEIPVPSSNNNILLVHQMISPRDHLNGLVNFTLCSTLLKSVNKYDLIISGDNHQTFNYKNRILNSGSLMRLKIDQVDHKPGLFVWHNSAIIFVPFEISPSNEIFDLNEIEYQKEINENMKEWILALDDISEIEEFNFVEEIESWMNTHPDDDVNAILKECIACSSKELS